MIGALLGETFRLWVAYHIWWWMGLAVVVGWLAIRAIRRDWHREGPKR